MERNYKILSYDLDTLCLASCFEHVVTALTTQVIQAKEKNDAVSKKFTFWVHCFGNGKLKNTNSSIVSRKINHIGEEDHPILKIKI